MARQKEPNESARQRHERLVREEPSREPELHRKMSSKMLAEIVLWMGWYGESAEEAADATVKYFDGVTKEEIDTASRLLAYIAKSTVFEELRKRTKGKKV